MAGITLDRLIVAGFRAYLHEQEVALRQHARPKSLAVFAPNAKGKSSLVDALEFFFSEDGTLERLGQRRSGRRAGREALEHVKARDEGIASVVSIGFHSEEGAFDGRRAVTECDGPRPEAAERVRRACKLDFIIRGYQLRHFVDRQEPSDRYREVSEWFGLSALLQIQNNLRAVRRHIKDTIDTDRATAERQRDLSTATNNALTVWDETAVIAWVTEHYLKPLNKDLSLAEFSEADAGYQIVKKKKEDEDESTGLALLRQVRSAIHAVCEEDTLQQDRTTRDAGAMAAFYEAVESLSLAKDKEQEERTASAEAVFTTLWEAAQPILENADISLQLCPVCETPFSKTAKGSREAVGAHIRSELESLQTYRSARKALQYAQQALQQRLQELRTRISILENVLGEAHLHDQLDLVKAYALSLAAWENGQDAPDSQSFSTSLNELERRIQEDIKLKVEEQGEHTWEKALNKIDAFIDLSKRFTHIRKFREELWSLHDNLFEQEKFIAGHMRTYGQTVIDTLMTRVNEIFRAVHPNEEAPIVRLQLNPDTRRPELTLLLDFASNRQGVPPSGYLSDSQIHTLALSLRLAAIQMFNSDVPLIVLDDVVTSYDADHRRAIAGMLADQFNDHQIIIVTHDERFFVYLKEQLPQDKWIYKRITKLDRCFGPRFHDHKVSEELIEGRHHEDRSAAHEMRQCEEEWLTQICRDFGVDVRIRDIHRPYEYGRAELAVALAAFLKHKHLKPPRVQGVANRFLNTLQSGVVENFGNHFQDNPHGFGSVGDENTRWREFKEFRRAFRCPKCDHTRFKQPVDMDHPVCKRNACEAQFAFE